MELIKWLHRKCVVSEYFRENFRAKGKEYLCLENPDVLTEIQESIIRELVGNSLSWASNIQRIIDPHNWNIGRILDNADQDKRPRAMVYLDMRITQRGNLVIDWYPSRYANPSHEDSDFRIWSTYYQTKMLGIPGFGSYDENRLVMIHDFSRVTIFKSYRDGHPSETNRMIVQAAINLAKHIEEVLSYSVNVTWINFLYFLTDENGEIYAAQVRNVEREKKRQAEEAKKAWYEGNFTSINATPEMLLETFKKSGLKYAPTYRSLLAEGIDYKSPCNVKDILVKLYIDYPDIYDAVLDRPPSQDLKPREKSLVFPASAKEGGHLQ
jgi:hypothetical protein